MFCTTCKGTGIHTKLVEGVGCEGQPLNDGIPHPTRCKRCAGTGNLEQVSRHFLLGRCSVFEPDGTRK